MTFEDLSLWWANAEAEDALKQQVINRIGSYITASESQPKDFQLQNFAGMLNFDRDAYALIASHNPDWLPDLQEAIYGSQWNWAPEQVAKLLGYSSPSKMLTRDKDEKALPQWMKLIKEGEDPSQWLDTHYGSRENLESGKLYSWLDAAQKQFDRAQKYGSWDSNRKAEGIQNALRAFFAPRTQEAMIRHGDYQGKDAALDFLENVAGYGLTPVAFGRLGANIGAKTFGKPVLKAVGPIAEFIGTNAVSPFASEVADAEVYDDNYNPNRSRFSVSDVLTNTATNAATAPMVSAGVSSLGRRSGLDVASRSSLMDLMTADPYVKLKHEQSKRLSKAPVVSEKAPLSQLMTEAKIYDAVYGPRGQKIAKDLSDFNHAQWLHWMATTPEGQKAQELLKERLAAINKIKDAKIRMQKLEEFKQNQFEVPPTDILEAQGLDKDYGLSKNGKIVDVIEGNSDLDPAHNLDFGTSGDRSFKSLKHKEHHKEGRVDTEYPARFSEGDEAIIKLNEDPAIANYANVKYHPVKSTALPALSSYITNKLGKDTFGERLLGEKVPELGEMDEEVKQYLNDDALVRMWREGFVPKGNPDEPIMRAFKIFKENENKQKPSGKKAGL